MNKIKQKISSIIAFAMAVALLFTATSYDSWAAENGKLSDTSKETTTVNAQVGDNAAVYYVTFPQSISLGNIGTEAVSVEYTVTVTMENTKGGVLRVSTPTEGYFYLNGDETSTALKYTNTFGTRDFTESTTVTGTISVSKEDAQKAGKGTYAGSLSVTSTFYDSEEDLPEVEEDTTTGAEKTVHIMNHSDIAKESMCNPLFYPKAYLTDNGDGTTTVTLYCIDPVPGFASAGKPVGQLNVCDGEDAIIAEKVKKLPYKAAGVYIAEDGVYDSDSITFTVKNSAIRNSSYGALYADVYVETVMNVWQKLYIVIDDVSDWGQGVNFVPEAAIGSTERGLEEYAAAYPENDALAELTMTISKAKTQTGGDDLAAKTAIEQLLELRGYNRTTNYYDITIVDADKNEITNTGKDHVIEVAMPWSYDSSKVLSIYRVHGDENEVKTFSSLKSRVTDLSYALDGTFYYDTDAEMLYLYASKFSVFGIHEEDKANVKDETTSTTDTTTTEDEEKEKSGLYTYTVTMKKFDSFSTTSMCNSLFCDQALVNISGSSATVTLYVIDPIPNYQSYGTPISDIAVYNTSGTKLASGTLSSQNQVNAYFSADASFIPKSGYYKADAVTFTVPLSYIESSSSKSMYMSTYVNAVMKSTQKFYLSFTNGKSGNSVSTSSSSEDISKYADADTEDKTDGTSESLEVGTYQVKVGAKKTNSDEASMMETYMYEYADLVVGDSDCKLTIYIQHTVAGKDGGGPKYLKYNSVESVKKENAKTIDGVAYDSFTITTEKPIPSELLVEMHINAMNMDVSCRIQVDTSSIKSGAATENSGAKSSANSSSNSSTASNKGTSSDNGGTTVVDDSTTNIEDSGSALAEGLGLTDENGNLQFTAHSVFVWIILILIAVAVLGIVGYNLYLVYQRKSKI